MTALAPVAAGAASPSPLLWQVERVLLDCRVEGPGADRLGAAARGRLCRDAVVAARTGSGRPAVPVAQATAPDPLSDLTVTLVARVSPEAGGAYRLAVSAKAARRGFPGGGAVRRQGGGIRFDADGGSRAARALVTGTLEALFGAPPASSRGGRRIPSPGVRL